MADQGQTIVCVHLYDDYSGSSNVFAQAITALKEAGHSIVLLVGSHGASGFLRDQHAARAIHYRLAPSTAGKLVEFFSFQFRLYVAVRRLLRFNPGAQVYANTLLPMGAVLAGVSMRRRVVTHVHEVGLGSRRLFQFLKWLASWGSTEIVCVSRHVATSVAWPPSKTRVVYNSLAPSDWQQADGIRQLGESSRQRQEFVVLMACSLRWYKGLDSFLALAHRFAKRPPDPTRPVRFELIVNSEQDELSRFVAGQELPTNLTIVRRPGSVYDHYRHADLVVNLSHREGWVETFGLTLLEAMACAIPVVSPVTGGCVELFEDGEGGWRIDSRDLDGLEARIDSLHTDGAAWLLASQRAYLAACRFAPDAFKHGIQLLFTE